MRTSHVLVVLLLVVGLIGGTYLLGPDLVERFTAAVAKGQAQTARAALPSAAEAERISALFHAVANAVGPAVVEVRVTRRIPNPFGGEQGLPPGFEDFLRNLPPGMRPNIPSPDEGDGQGDNQGDGRGPDRGQLIQQGLGSGVIVDAANGYVLTNNHVVSGADKVRVVLADGRSFETDWVRSDPKSDLAVVKIDAGQLTAAPLGDSDVMEVGDWVLAIGSPEGLEQSVTAGIISAKNRAPGGGSEQYQSFLQTDAAINQGNSGGPLVNMRGEVVGINAAIYSRSGGNEGIGFAIPSSMARWVMRQLIDVGKVVRGYLGVSMQDMTPELADTFGLTATEGVLVNRVAPGSPAEKAGLKPDDIVTGLDGQPVRDGDSLRNRVAAIRPGAEHTLTIIRDGKPQDVKITVGEQPESMTEAFRPGGPRPTPQRAPRGREAVQRIGISVQTLSSELARAAGFGADVKGAVITSVAQDSEAAEKGLSPGLVIRRVGSREIASAEDFASAVDQAQAGKPLRLYVESRDGGARYIVLTPSAQPTTDSQPARERGGDQGRRRRAQPQE